MRLVWMTLSLVLTGCFPPIPDADVSSSDVDDVEVIDDTASVDSGAPDTVDLDSMTADSVDTDSGEGLDTVDDDTLIADTEADSSPADTLSDTGSSDADANPPDTSSPDTAPECSSDADCLHLAVPPCIAGTCDDGTCVEAVSEEPCDDGDPCTTEDACTASGCTGRPWTDAESVGWAALFDGPGDDYATDLAMHPSGDLTVVGMFQQSAVLAGEARVARGDAGEPDAFVARFAADGAPLWVAQAGGGGADLALHVVADGEDALVSGWFQATATFGAGENEVQLSAADELGQSYLARYSSGGVLTSVRRMPGFVRSLRLVPASGGDLVLLSAFEETVTLDAGSNAPDVALTSVGGLDYLIARFASDGAVKWAARAGSAGDDGRAFWAPSLAVSETGEVVASLFFGASGATYKHGGATTGLADAPSGSSAPTALFLSSNGALVGTRLFGDEQTLSLPASADWVGQGALVSGVRTSLTGDQHRLFVEASSASGVVDWSHELAGSSHVIGDAASGLVHVGHLGDMLVLIGMFASNDLILSYGTPLSPAVSADGPGPRLFVARYEATDGTPLGGVSSPESGGMVVTEAPYRSTFAPVGYQELLAAEVAISSARICITAPRLTAAFASAVLPGPPWLAPMEWVPQGDGGGVFCVATAHAFDCVVD